MGDGDVTVAAFRGGGGEGLDPAAALEALQGVLTGPQRDVAGLVDAAREVAPGGLEGASEVMERVQLALIRECSRGGSQADLRGALERAGVVPEQLEQMVGRGDWGPRWMEKLKTYYWTVQLPKYCASLRGSVLGGSWRHFEMLARLFGEDEAGRAEQWRKLVDGMEGASDEEVLAAALASRKELDELIERLGGTVGETEEARVMEESVEREVAGGGGAV